MGLGTLDFGFGNIVRQAGPFSECEMDEIIDAGKLVGHEVDTPESRKISLFCWYGSAATYPVSL